MNNWSNFYLNGTKCLQLPSETLVRIMKGTYITNLSKDYSNKKVLEVGFGSGNNLIFLHSLGMQVSGTEIQQNICNKTMNNLQQIGINADLRKGCNTMLPFDDNSFDYLVSWDVLHYEGKYERVVQALKEYKRVMRAGGRIFLSTIGVKNALLDKADVYQPHEYTVRRAGDFRAGETLFCFSDKMLCEKVFGEFFGNVEVGRTTSDLFSRIVDCFIVTGINK